MTLKDLKEKIDELEKLIKKQNIKPEDVNIDFTSEWDKNECFKDIMNIRCYLPANIHKIQITGKISI